MAKKQAPCKSLASLKKILDRFYREFDYNKRKTLDPIEIPHRFAHPEDIEISGFIASSFAYGRVDLFKPVIEKILLPAGDHPAEFIRNFSLKKEANYYKGINYRFNKANDVLCFIYILSRTLKKWGSLQKLFDFYDERDDSDIKEGLKGFVSIMREVDTSPVYGRNVKPPGLTQLLPSPDKGSACKRMNLFLRWMVRKDDIDFGIWDDILPSRLVIPLDTHISRISRCLGLTSRTASDWKAAKEITESLKKFDPEDPLKYDFALCHQGISGLCKGVNNREICSSCEFLSLPE